MEPVYGDMFKADNDQSKEMIFPLRYEGEDTMTWGGMTALLCWGSADFKKKRMQREVGKVLELSRLYIISLKRG